MSKLEYHRDQVEEVFIQDLNESEIINWLEKNKNNNNFRGLREKYEPEWRKQSKKLKYAVAKYGYTLSVLRDIYFSEDDEVLKGLVLINPNFGDVLHTRHGIGSDEIIRLYKKRRPFFGLFERIFKNYAIAPDFISDLYSSEYYPEIKQGDLALILDYLSQYATDEKGKTPIENWVNNFDRYAIGLESNRALEKIVSFIANYKFKNKYSYQEIEVFYRALERIGNIEISVSAVSEIETIRKFDPSQFSKDDLNYGGEEMLISISAWFEKRILSRNPSFLKKEFKKSKGFQERRMYYSYAYLSDLLAVSYFNTPQFLPIPEWIIWSDKYGDENDVAKAVPKKGVTAKDDILIWSSINHKTAFTEFHKHLIKDSQGFIGGLALNMNLYETKTTRKWLKEVCKLADENFGLVWDTTVPILGTGTCSEIFETKLAQVKEEKPDYFRDESKETNLEDIQKELQTLKTLVDQVSKNTVENKQNFSQLDEINDMLNRTNNKVSAQLKTMEEQIQYVQGQIKNQNIEQNVPNDLMARIIFNIPIFGRLLKSFFR